MTTAGQGDGTVSYEDPFSAASAVQWFNDKEWKGVLLKIKQGQQLYVRSPNTQICLPGSKLKVSLAENKQEDRYGGGGGSYGRRGGGGYSGGGGGGYSGGGGGGGGGRYGGGALCMDT